MKISFLRDINIKLKKNIYQHCIRVPRLPKEIWVDLSTKFSSYLPNHLPKDIWPELCDSQVKIQNTVTGPNIKCNLQFPNCNDDNKCKDSSPVAVLAALL